MKSTASFGINCLNLRHKIYIPSQVFKTSVLAYHQEAVWRDKNYVPPLKEYLMNGSISSCACPLGLSSILGMGHADTIGECKWAAKEPKAVLAAEKMSRIINDIVGYEEAHSRPHVATSIDCYMKDYGVSKEEAVVKLYEMIEDTWKDINEECLRPTTVGSHYINIFLNLMRVSDVTYKNRDGYTHPDTMKYWLLDVSLCKRWMTRHVGLVSWKHLPTCIMKRKVHYTSVIPFAKDVLW
ncbi:(E)-beta-caryophyllene synthase [Heracleum sosnowskyi]|uniref:(E)-beta-caryophyllene synthase n=1 Tax=Heracleum sosnowskyi TaxID=360622 RepID=A0AAD8I9U0_9APIA|nr:(E)-beta-caryophyllene synthase [Heracleum sosnowskyi]